MIYMQTWTYFIWMLAILLLRLHRINRLDVVDCFQTILSIALSFVGGIDKLINYMTVCNLMQQSTAVAALIYIRYRHIPVHPQAIRVDHQQLIHCHNCHFQFPIILPILLFLFSILLIVIPIIQDTVTTIVGFGFTLGGIAAYYLFIFPNKRFEILQTLNGRYHHP